MERIKISPYAKKTAKALGVDISALSGSGPDGRIIWRDVDAAAARKAAHASVREMAGGTAGLYTSADVSELLAGLASLGGALTLSAFLERACAKLSVPVMARNLGPGIEGGVPRLRPGEQAVLVFGGPAEGRLRLYLAYDSEAWEDETAAAALRSLRSTLENPLSLLV